MLSTMKLQLKELREISDNRYTKTEAQWSALTMTSTSDKLRVHDLSRVTSTFRLWAQ